MTLQLRGSDPTRQPGLAPLPDQDKSLKDKRLLSYRRVRPGCCGDESLLGQASGRLFDVARRASPATLLSHLPRTTLSYL
jgi:hypothetical protein